MPDSPALPDPEAIRRTAEEVIQRPRYRLEPMEDRSAFWTELFLELMRWVLKPFIWLFDAMEGLPDWIRWTVVVGLVLLLVALVAHIIYTLLTAIQAPRRDRRMAIDAAERRADPAALERDADAAVAREDYIAAVRLLFRACLLRLERRERHRFPPGMTNRDCLRRYQESPFREPMGVFVETIDTKWYGAGICRADDYEACRQAHRQFRQLISESPHAQSA